MDRLDESLQPARYQASRRGRGVAGLLSLAVCLLLGAMLVSMGAFTPLLDKPGGTLVAVSISAPKGDKADKAAPAHQQAAAHNPAQSTAVQAAAMPPPRVVLPSPNKVEWPEGFIPMSHADFASADIGKIRAAPGAGAGMTDGGGRGGGGGGSGDGEGPGGAHLYNAEWYRKPRDAEIAGYMRGNTEPGGWAMIICRTVAGYHVEDCQEMDESPRGSGTARALRQAAWQFLVRPPRVDGKPMIGTWVRIRFDFTRGKRDDDGGGGAG